MSEFFSREAQQKTGEIRGVTTASYKLRDDSTREICSDQVNYHSTITGQILEPELPISNTISNQINNTLEAEYHRITPEEIPPITAQTFRTAMIISAIITYTTVIAPMLEGTFYYRGGTDEQMANKPGNESLHSIVSKQMRRSNSG